jgi:hypothetical protein
MDKDLQGDGVVFELAPDFRPSCPTWRLRFPRVSKLMVNGNSPFSLCGSKKQRPIYLKSRRRIQALVYDIPFQSLAEFLQVENLRHNGAKHAI